MTYVVDTNVAIRANEIEPPHEILDCCEACVLRLRTIMESGRVAIDDAGLIWEEYKRYMRWHGQPGAGHEFFKWLHDNEWNEQRCDRVPMAPFPEDPPALAEFDASDRKFVQVAIGHSSRPPILVAADRGWRRHKDNLANHVKIEFLCEVSDR